jgi:hypothetical protein
MIDGKSHSITRATQEEVRQTAIALKSSRKRGNGSIHCSLADSIAVQLHGLTQEELELVEKYVQFIVWLKENKS